MNRPPFPSVIDSSMLADFRSCPTRTRMKYFEHWKPRDLSIHLHAGKSFAAGAEATRLAFYLGQYKVPRGEEQYEILDGPPGDERRAIACGLRVLLATYGDFPVEEGHPKSASQMAGALEYFFSVAFPLTRDHAEPVALSNGKRGIEVSFAEPLEFPHPETGDPILFSGRLDMLTHYAGGLFGEDDKTTSRLGESWARQWDLRSQFIGYSWGVKKLGYPIQGFLVRGISLQKTGYKHAEASPYYPQWLIDEWYEQVHLHDLPAMVRMWESGKWGRSLAEACNEYGGCEFKVICLSDPAAREGWLEGSFERRRWDPVTRTEVVL